MRPGWLPACILLVPIALAGGATHVSFDSPGQWNGSASVDGQWALLVFHEDAARIGLTGYAERTTNHSVAYVGVDIEPVIGGAPGMYLPPQSEQIEADIDQDLIPGQGWSSLFVSGDRLSATLSNGSGQVVVLPAGTASHVAFPEGFQPYHVYRSHFRDVDEPVLAWAAASLEAASFTLNASGVRDAEWSNHDVACQSEQCLDGARPQEYSDGPAARGRVQSFRQVDLANGTVTVNGDLVGVVIGGRSLDVGVLGELRMPLATLEGECRECQRVEDQTITVEGELSLQGLAVAKRNRMETTISGDVVGSRIDEQWTDPQNLWPAAVKVVGAVAFTALLWKLVWFLQQRDPLAQPTRRLIHAIVLKHPGCSYRELMGLTGRADGTTRHHLEKLRAAGLVAAMRGQDGVVRYFENHGRYDKEWLGVAALRDPQLRHLCEWLTENPGSRLKDICKAMHDWPRSTTRYRLSKLLDWGLINRTNRRYFSVGRRQ